MDVNELQSQKIGDLTKFAQELEIEEFAGLSKQELILSILEAHNKKVVAFDKDLKLKKKLIAEIKRTWPYVKKLFNKKKLN